MSSKFLTKIFLMLFLITVSTTVFAVDTMDVVVEEELIEENLVEELENETIENTTLVIKQTLDNNTLDKINQTINFVFENCLADDYGFSRAKNSGSNLGVSYQALVTFSSLDKQITDNSSIKKYLDSGKPVTYIKNTLPKVLQEWDYTYALGILTFLNIGPEYQGINFLDKTKEIFNIKLNDEYIWDEVSLINILSYYKDSDKDSKEIIKKAVALLKSTINKEGLWGYSVKGDFSDSDMTALVIYSLINSGEVSIDDPLLKEAYDNIIKNFYINGSGIRSPALANSPANSVTTATTLRAAYYLNNKSLDMTNQAINDSMSFIETMRDTDGGYRLSQDNKESDCLTTLSILPIISFKAYSEPKPHNITHEKYTVTKINVGKKEYVEKTFNNLPSVLTYIKLTISDDPYYILLKNYNHTEYYDNLSLNVHDSLVMHNGPNDSIPAILSYKRNVFGCLFSEEDNTVNTGEVVSFSIISTTQELYNGPVKVYVNGEYKIDAEEDFFSLTFDEPGKYKVTIDNEEIISLNEISIEVIEPKSYHIHLRVESPRETLFDDEIGAEPITVTVKDETNLLQGQYYISDTVLNPIVNALDNSGIEYEIDNAQGFSFRLLSQYPRTEEEGWHYLINNEPTLGTASLEKLNDGDDMLWYYGRANSEPLFIYYNNTPIKENKAMPNDIILTVKGLNSTISNAEIYIDKELYGTTDESGNLELSISGGRYSIKAQKKGMINSKEYIVNVKYEAIYIVFYALIGVMSLIIISILINSIYKRYRK